MRQVLGPRSRLVMFAVLSWLVVASAVGCGGESEPTAAPSSTVSTTTTVPASPKADVVRACEKLESLLSEEQGIVLEIQKEQAGSAVALDQLVDGYAVAASTALQEIDSGPAFDAMSDLKVAAREYRGTDWTVTGNGTAFIERLENTGRTVERTCSSAGADVSVYPYIGESPAATTTTVDPASAEFDQCYSQLKYAEATILDYANGLLEKAKASDPPTKEGFVQLNYEFADELDARIDEVQRNCSTVLPSCPTVADSWAEWMRGYPAVIRAAAAGLEGKDVPRPPRPSKISPPIVCSGP
jgi:hypothetical protein